MLHVHCLTHEDWAVWRALRLRALADAPRVFGAKSGEFEGAHDSEARWRARLRALPLHAVAYQDDEAVGMISGARPDAASVELLALWVAPNARRQGVGAALIALLVAWAATAGAERVQLRVYASNLGARALYRSAGFQELRQIKRRSRGREHAWFMVRACGASAPTME